MQNELFDLYTAGKIKPNMMQTFALDDAAGATGVVGRILLLQLIGTGGRDIATLSRLLSA